MKPKSSGLPNEDEDDVVSFGSDEATMIRPRSVLDDAFDARTVVQVGNRNQFTPNAEPAHGQRFGDEPAAKPVAPAPAERSVLPDPPPDLEMKRVVPAAPPMQTSSTANAVTGKKLRKDLSAGTNTNFPIPKPEHPLAEPVKMEVKSPTPEMKRVPPAPAPAPAPVMLPIAPTITPSTMASQIPAPIVHVAPPTPTPVPAAPKREPKVEPKVDAKVEVKTEAKADLKTEAKADVKAEIKPEMKAESKPDVKPEMKSAQEVRAEAHHDSFSDAHQEMNFEPQRRAFPKKVVTAAIAALAVIAYFVFGTSSPKGESHKDLASAEETLQTTKTKMHTAGKAMPDEKLNGAPAPANNPVASVATGTQAVLQQFDESYNKTQGRTRADSQAD